MTDLSAVFERSPALLSRLVPRVAPTDTPEDVIAKARVVVESLDDDALIATLNAHPRIGADTRGMSELSRAEQGPAEDPRILAELDRLNLAYERRFGFRFVVFVNGRRKSDLAPVLRERLERSRDAELRTGIEQFLAISLDRLRKMRAARA